MSIIERTVVYSLLYAGHEIIWKQQTVLFFDGMVPVPGLQMAEDRQGGGLEE